MPLKNESNQTKNIFIVISQPEVGVDEGKSELLIKLLDIKCKL